MEEEEEEDYEDTEEEAEAEAEEEEEKVVKTTKRTSQDNLPATDKGDVESSQSDKSEDDAEIIEEKELVIDEKELGSDESIECKEIEPEKQPRGKKKFEFIFSPLKISEQTETVYVNPLTYFNCNDPKSNPLMNTTFVDRYGSKIKSDYALKGKDVVALFFSDSSCGRGIRLLPTLKKIHEKAEEYKKKFEIVYVCFDYTKEDMMHDLRLNHGNWFAIDFDDPMRDTLRNIYGILALPQLIALDEYGDVITRTGIVEVESIKTNVLVTWFND